MLPSRCNFFSRSRSTSDSSDWNNFFFGTVQRRSYEKLKFLFIFKVIFTIAHAGAVLDWIWCACVEMYQFLRRKIVMAKSNPIRHNFGRYPIEMRWRQAMMGSFPTALSSFGDIWPGKSKYAVNCDLFSLNWVSYLCFLLRFDAFHCLPGLLVFRRASPSIAGFLTLLEMMNSVRIENKSSMNQARSSFCPSQGSFLLPISASRLISSFDADRVQKLCSCRPDQVPKAPAHQETNSSLPSFVWPTAWTGPAVRGTLFRIERCASADFSCFLAYFLFLSEISLIFFSFPHLERLFRMFRCRFLLSVLSWCIPSLFTFSLFLFWLLPTLDFCMLFRSIT